MELLIDKITRIISEETGREPQAISLNDRIDELTDDSIRLFTLVTRFEKEFGFQAKYEDLIRIVTVDDVRKYLEERRSL